MKTNLFCITDTHGKAPPQVPQEANYCLHAGDFYNRLGGKVQGLGIIESQRLCNSEESLSHWYNSMTCLVHFVKGNHDTFDPYNIMSRNDVTGCVTQLAPKLFLIGLGWSGMVYYELPTKTDMQKVCADVLRQCCFKMKDGDSSIVLTHYAPLVPPISDDPSNGEGWAYDCITKVIDAIRPILVVNGHLHKRQGTQSEYNGTLIDFPPKEGRMHTIDLDTMRLV